MKNTRTSDSDWLPKTEPGIRIDPGFLGEEVPHHVLTFSNPAVPPRIVAGPDVHDELSILHAKGFSCFRWMNGKLATLANTPFIDYMDAPFHMPVRLDAPEVLACLKVAPGARVPGNVFPEVFVYAEPVDPHSLAHAVFLNEAGLT